MNLYKSPSIFSFLIIFFTSICFAQTPLGLDDTPPPVQSTTSQVDSTDNVASQQQDISDRDLPSIKNIRVYNANIKKEGSSAAYARRVGNVAKKMAEDDNTRQRAANLFAIVEAFYKRKGWWTDYHERRRIPCEITEKSQWTHECLYNTWVPELEHSLRANQKGAIGEQYGDVAILAAKIDFQLLPNSSYIKERICPGGWGRLQYKIIGVRLLINGTDKVLPFYSVHVVTKKGGEGRQKSCAKDIVKIVKNNFVAGDLTPLVVGDFNFTESDSPYPIMEKDFTEVVRQHFGRKDIEHFWLGKNEAFSENGGVLVPRRIDFGDSFCDWRSEDHGSCVGEKTMTDHNIPMVVFSLPKP